MSLRAILTFFLTSWCFYGMLVNTRDLGIYTLQHAGVEAITERGTYVLGGSPTPQLQNPGDTFSFRDRIFAAKQPGQFTLGALPYSIIRAFGVSYRSNYELAAAFVSWCTTGLFLALTATLLLHLVTSIWGFGPSVGLLVGLSVGFGQGGFAYISVPHHDVLATFFLVLALWAIEVGRQGRVAKGWPLALIAGFALGLAVWTSMLSVPVVAGLGLYAMIRLPGVPYLFSGAILGACPLLYYNTAYFGHPLTPPNLVGNFRDTFFSWNFERFLSRISLYLGLGD